MAKVVLINPPSAFLICDRDQPPMGILSIAAYLRERGHEVSVTDLAGVPEEAWFVPDADHYGLTATTPQYPTAKRIIQKLKGRKATITIGGYHASALSKRTLAESGADYVVIGEGENAMASIIEDSPPKGFIHGKLADVNTLPRPAWDMIDAHDYATIGTNSFMGDPPGNFREGYVQTGRGCPYTCNFCGQELITERLARYLTTDKVIEHMQWWVERVGASRFYLFDDTFTLKKSRVRDVCEAILDNFCGTVDWHCLSTVKDISEDLLESMALSGCKCITFGIESLSDRVLPSIDESLKMSADKNMRAMEMTVNAGMKSRCQLIVGLPGESWDSVRETAARIRDLPREVVVGVHVLVPLPGSRIWNDLSKYGFGHIDPETVDFDNFTTIGKPGHHNAAPLHENGMEVLEWRDCLVEAAGQRNIATYAQRRMHTS